MTKPANLSRLLIMVVLGCFGVFCGFDVVFGSINGPLSCGSRARQLTGGSGQRAGKRVTGLGPKTGISLVV